MHMSTAALGCMSSITSPSQLTVAAEGLVESVENSVVNTGL